MGEGCNEWGIFASQRVAEVDEWTQKMLSSTGLETFLRLGTVHLRGKETKPKISCFSCVSHLHSITSKNFWFLCSHIKKKVNSLGLGNLFNWHNGTIENSSVDDLCISLAKTASVWVTFHQLCKSTLTRSLEVSKNIVTNSCFHDNTNQWKWGGEERSVFCRTPSSVLLFSFLAV